jgi:hypothetical protein
LQAPLAPPQLMLLLALPECQSQQHQSKQHPLQTLRQLRPNYQRL